MHQKLYEAFSFCNAFAGGIHQGDRLEASVQAASMSSQGLYRFSELTAEARKLEQDSFATLNPRKQGQTSLDQREFTVGRR